MHLPSNAFPPSSIRKLVQILKASVAPPPFSGFPLLPPRLISQAFHNTRSEEERDEASSNLGLQIGGHTRKKGLARLKKFEMRDGKSAVMVPLIVHNSKLVS
jgi:hypothetical protein